MVFTVIFIAVQPYNWFCGITQKCNTFHFSYLIPRKEGKDRFNIQLNVLNYSKNFSFESVEKSITTVPHRKNVVYYRAKNLSKKTIYLRPKLNIEPKEFEPYITIYDCLCTKVYKLKRGEEIEIKMTFKLLGSINNPVISESYRNTNKPISLSYLVK